MIISLMGFMGSGKSSIGRRLSAQMGLPLIDLDDYIVERERRSINEIFEEHGESFFRLLETHYLTQVLERYDEAIVALGGGTPCQEQNWPLLHATTSVYLRRKKSYLYDNLKKKKSKRPIIKKLSDKKLKKLINDKMTDRAPYYERADIIINAQGSKRELTDRVVKKVHKYNK